MMANSQRTGGQKVQIAPIAIRIAASTLMNVECISRYLCLVHQVGESRQGCFGAFRGGNDDLFVGTLIDVSDGKHPAHTGLEFCST
jgi:hypothetical protein